MNTWLLGAGARFEAGGSDVRSYRTWHRRRNTTVARVAGRGELR